MRRFQVVNRAIVKLFKLPSVLQPVTYITNNSFVKFHVNIEP